MLFNIGSLFVIALLKGHYDVFISKKKHKGYIAHENKRLFAFLLIGLDFMLINVIGRINDWW